MWTLKDWLCELMFVLLATLMFLLGAGIFSILMFGCGGLVHPSPKTAQQLLPVPPAQAYQDATCALTRMGGRVTVANGSQGLLSGDVHDAVTLTVVVSPKGTGTLVQVTGQVLPNKLVVGRFTEVDDYLALLRTAPCRQKAQQ